MEKDIEETKAKADALNGEHAELERQCGIVSQHCEELKQAQEQDTTKIAKLTEHRCQVFPCYLHCRGNMQHFHHDTDNLLVLARRMMPQYSFRYPWLCNVESTWVQLKIDGLKNEKDWAGGTQRSIIAVHVHVLA